MDNFKPIFKEKNTDNQFVYEGDKWRSAEADEVSALFNTWISTKNIHRFIDENGYLVFGVITAEE